MSDALLLMLEHIARRPLGVHLFLFHDGTPGIITVFNTDGHLVGFQSL